VWDSFEQFLVAWFIHTIAVIVLMAVAAVPIMRFHKFFLGHEHEGFKSKFEEMCFLYINDGAGCERVHFLRRTLRT
jgi:hypothetical protein